LLQNPRPAFLRQFLCMLRVPLPPDPRAAAQAARRDPTLSPLERDRVEMLLLSGAGWHPPAIAHHLDYHAATVRHALKAYLAQGLAGLRHQRPGPPPDTARREQVT
jgi:putative transposase